MKKPNFNFNPAQMLFIPLCIIVMSLSSFKNAGVESSKNVQSTYIIALNVFHNQFTDLSGNEYMDFSVEFHEVDPVYGEYPIYVSNLTVNYSIATWPNNPGTIYRNKVCSGIGDLLEGQTIYYDASTYTSYIYTVEDGDGYVTSYQ